MICILAEKPDVATKIAAALGGIKGENGTVIPFEKLQSSEKAIRHLRQNGYLETVFNGERTLVTWGYGHLCELKQAVDYNESYKQWTHIPLPFIPEKYEIKRKSAPGSFGTNVRNQLATIKELFRQADTVINATDFDREGEVIFSYIYEYLKCRKPVKRVCYSSMTKDGFQTAFSQLKDGSEMRLTEAAGRMRSIADWVVGINLTVAMTVRNPSQGILSVGRVQTPTLKIVVDREKEIRAFKPEPYWTVNAVFTTAAGETYPGTHTRERFTSEREATDELNRLLSEGKNATVTDITQKSVKRYTPHLYSLAALQMDANARYGMTLKQTLDAAQSLYSDGYTTYPRTSSQYLTEDMYPTVIKVLYALKENPQYTHWIEGRNKPAKSKYWFDDSKVDSHFAIIPTGVRPPDGKLGTYEARVYDLICKSVIRMLYGPAELEQTKVITTAAGADFVSNGSVVKDPGWMAVDGMTNETVLPPLKKGDAVSGAYTSERKETKPPKRYTDKTLLAAMIAAGKDLEDEELKQILADPSVGGIGTGATRDAIIETLIMRDYMVRKQKVFYATERGIALIDALPLEDVKSPAMTAVWEKRLANIQKGTEDAAVFQRELETTLIAWCGAFRALPKGFFNDALKNAEALLGMGESADDTGETDDNNNPPNGNDGNKNPASGNAAGANKPKGRGGSSAVSLFCPRCGSPMKKLSWGWACTNPKEQCGFTVGSICSKKLTDNQVGQLLTKGRTAQIAGFKSKAGKSFSAALKLNPETKKIEFDFSGQPKGRNGTAAANKPKPTTNKPQPTMNGNNSRKGE